jgi:hypothetical protein
MSYSVVSRYCEAQVGVALDGSVASLAGLDRYLALLAPAELVHDPSSLWLTRVAVLAGAYLGEVLADARGGQWLDVDSETPTADAYRLRLAGDLQILPVAHAVQRMTGRSSMPLRDFAAQLLK